MRNKKNSGMKNKKKNLTKIIQNHPWEHYHKRTTVGGCPGLSDDPEKTPQDKTLTTQLNNFGHESRSFTEMKVDTMSPGRAPLHLLKHELCR